jgi:hypothetical protein
MLLQCQQKLSSRLSEMLSIHSLLLPRVQYRSKPNRATLEKLVTPTKGVTMLFRFCKLGRVRGGVGWGTAVLAVAAAVAFVGSVSSASAAACSTTSGASSCTVTGSLTVTAGTLSLESSPNLYWALDASGYDQWASGSSATLSGCAISGTATHCSGGVSPTLEVLDATGSAAGWAVSEYLSANTLPSGYALHFDGAGSSTYGYSQASPIATDPFAGTTPGNVCDYASSCTVATAATTCAHSALGFTTCPAYPVTMGGTSATTQVDLYSAAASSSEGAICFASGTATGAGRAGATTDAYYNLGIKGGATAGTTAVTINLAVTSGP